MLPLDRCETNIPWQQYAVEKLKTNNRIGNGLLQSSDLFLFVSSVRVKMRNILTSRQGISYEQAQALNKLFELGIAETK